MEGRGGECEPGIRARDMFTTVRDSVDVVSLACMGERRHAHGTFTTARGSACEAARARQRDRAPCASGTTVYLGQELGHPTLQGVHLLEEKEAVEVGVLAGLEGVLCCCHCWGRVQVFASTAMLRDWDSSSVGTVLKQGIGFQREAKPLNPPSVACRLHAENRRAE